MIDDRIDASMDDEVGDVADDVIYVHDADDEDNPDAWDDQARPSRFGWASVVTGAHDVLTWGRRRPGGADGTGAG